MAVVLFVIGVVACLVGLAGYVLSGWPPSRDDRSTGVVLVLFGILAAWLAIMARGICR